MSRFFIVTGESSGDKLGAIIGEALLSKKHAVAGWGGGQMKSSGVRIFRDIAALKVMGWTDVLRKLPQFVSLFSKCKKDIISFNPDTIILIDFGSFNLRIARWAKKRGYKIVYYSPPKVWASRPGRIKELKAFCDLIIVLFPFEKEYFLSKGVAAEFFGHPLANTIMNYNPDPSFKSDHGLDDRPIMAILPGSRHKEIKRTLPIYLETVKDFSGYQICISSAEGMDREIERIVSNRSDHVTIVSKGYYDLLCHSDLAIVTSGTAALEAALFKIPQVVCYRTNPVNYEIAKRLINTKYISLPNLIADREIIKELIQEDLKSEHLLKNLIRICQPDAKSILDISYNGIINEIFKENCLFNTIVAICGEKT